MKKILFLLVAFFLLMGVVVAQPGTICNPQFTVVPNANTVQCNPAMLDSLTSHLWNFGDGGTSTVKSPSHTYNSCSTYTIRHYIETRNPNGVIICKDSAQLTVTLSCNTACNVHAAFTSATLNNQLNVYQFTNTSTAPPAPAPVYSIWNFGDGSAPVSATGLTSPSHTYAASGLYNVCLKVISGQTVAGANCVDSVCHTVQVQVPNPTPCTLAPSFGIQSSPNQPNVFVFTNTTLTTIANPSVSWSFGDSTTAAGNSVTHTYTSSGTYWVCMRITISNTCSKDTCIAVTATVPSPPPTPCSIAPSFTWSANQQQANVITFTNTSTPINTAASISWSFGDSTTATGHNITHTYTHAGTYNVCMYISTSNTCNAYTCQTVTVTMPPTTNCNLTAGFTMQSNPAGTSPFTAIFTNTTTPLSPADSVTWYFGDSTVSHDFNPIHTYANPGVYSVCLMVQQAPTTAGTHPCVSYICHNISIAGTQNCNTAASFTWYADSANKRNIHFVNTTPFLSAGSSVMWSFGDGTSSTTNNPVHQYAFAGTYFVCLRVQTPNNCVVYTCDTVVVGNPNTTPLPQQCQLTSIPNPAHNQVSVNVYLPSAMPINIFVYNSLNVCVKRVTRAGTSGNNTLPLNIANLLPGYYTIRVYYGNQFCFARFQKI